VRLVAVLTRFWRELQNKFAAAGSAATAEASSYGWVAEDRRERIINRSLHSSDKLPDSDFAARAYAIRSVMASRPVLTSRIAVSVSFSKITSLTGTSTFRKFSNVEMICPDLRMRNQDSTKKNALLFWVWDTELAANLACEKIRDFRMSGNCRHSAGVGEIYIFAMLRAFVGEHASEPLQVSNELSPLQLHLNLFDHDLIFGQLR
jgi:hypothetical protein